MADMCVSWPYIGDEPSKLYMDIYHYTGKNRKLTNLIYATALQDWYKAKFSPSDFNSQKELNFDKIKEDLKIDEYIKTNDLVKDIEKLLNAVDSSGNPVEYSAISEIIDKVQKVNQQENSRVIARIINTGSKYIISVEPKDDTNYNIFEYYQSGIQQLEEVIKNLAAVGFNTLDLPVKALIAINALNALNFPTLLEKLQRITKPVYLSENQVELILHMMSGNIKVARLYDKFGDKTVKVVKHLLSGRTEVPEELADLLPLFSKATKDMLMQLRTEISRKANKINTSDLVNKLNRIYRGNTTDENESILKTLKDLYKNWHLDKDTIYASQDEITSLSDATQRVIRSLYNNILFLKSKGHISVDEQKEQEKKILELQRYSDKKQYLHSILKFLELVTSELETLSNIDVELVDLNSHNEVAFLILYARNLVSTYAPIIESLVNIDKLEQASELEVSDIDNIKKITGSLQEQLKSLEKDVKSKWFTAVYKYLKEKWGEDKKTFELKDKFVLGNFEVSLHDALQKGTDIELNVCDRLLFSLTEVSDPVLATFGLSIKDLHEVRDEQMKDIMLLIRRATDKLYKAGNTSEFMTQVLPDGTVKIVSEIDYEAYYQARLAFKENLRERGIKGEDFRRRLLFWEDENTEEYTVPGLRLIPEITGEDEHPVVMIAPKAKYRRSMPSMTDALKDYYRTMMSIKASMEYNLQRHGVTTSLFSPVQITSEISEAIANSSPKEAFKLLKDNLADKFSVREDDTVYGNLEVLTNAEGEELKQLPIYYIRKLKDLKRVSRDFSRAMLAYSAMATNYSVMTDHINSLELVKEFLLERKIEQKRGNASLIGVMNIGNTREINPVTKKTRETSTGDWIEGIMDTKVYGIRHKKAGNIKGTDISKDKAIDAAIAYSSVTGLAANVPGAIANMLVGKLQMIIEAGGGEFFNLKSYEQGSAKYWTLLRELLGELGSNNKKSMLHLLMQEFDVLDDFYDRIRETGFYTNGMNKIIGNTSLFFLYGMGEHLLHAQGMLACLYHTKVLDTKTNKKVPLIEVFDREIKDGNGKLIIKKGYKTLDGRDVDMNVVRLLKKPISYVNRSMHGAFGDDEKGLIHQYTWGRLVMNFRQWMPAHYARRFNSLHWDATLGDYREGYYVTCGKFVLDCAKLIRDRKFDLVTRYRGLNDMQKANLKRALTETMILILLTYLSRLSFGDDPKHRTKFEAMIKYEIKRMLLETSASDPLSVLQKGEFFDNIYKTLNSPIAAIAPAQKFTRLFGIDDLIFMTTVKSGPHEGELVYFRNMERAIPFYDQVYKWWHIDTDNSMFQIFNRSW